MRPQEPVSRLRPPGRDRYPDPAGVRRGRGRSWLYNVILAEEIVATGAVSGALPLHLNVVLPSFLMLANPSTARRPVVEWPGGAITVGKSFTIN